MFDKEKFREAVEKSGLKGNYIAKEMDMSYKIYLQRSNGLSKWKADEVMKFSEILRLRKAERDAIFLAKKVTKTDTEDEVVNQP